VHEWLALRGKPYGPDAELGRWLDAYARSTELAAGFANEHSLSRPVKTRAIAPTGTIAIIAETTSGMEPIFCKAYKRLLKEADAGGLDRTKAMYVVDPTARKLAEAGVDPNEVEDAYQLSYDVERRLDMQAWLQEYVDHGISSTINLPGPLTGPDQRDFGRAVLRHLPRLRGITAYPDGARDGQPLNPVPYDVAVGKQGVVFEESDDRCVSGSCGA
jgi:ribonucleoside-diphosphate reductase alpha chain